jgi:hypothetical protein
VVLLTPQRRKQVKRCIGVATLICEKMNGSKRITPDFWATYFDACAQDPFWSGRAPPGRGHEGWTPDFKNLTHPDVMTRIFERTVSDEPLEPGA